MTTNANEPAYPSIAPEFDGLDSEGGERWTNGPVGGLTKRELIAAMAMQGMLAYKAAWNPAVLAVESMEYADKLLAKLGEPT